MKSFAKFLWETFKIFLVAVAIVVPIRYFLFQPFFVKGESMVPSFEDGQYLIVDEISYRFRAPERGEAIVFKYPNDPSQKYIKRIIGLPGETVELKEGKIFINGEQLNEELYLSANVDTRSMSSNPIVVGQEEYFVLGDNRPASSDSRVWGLLPKIDIIGRVALRAWPFDVFQTPDYQN